MGLLKLPSLADYWSDESLYRVEAFQRVMSRDRFTDLLRHLHLADNDDMTGVDDKLAKFRPFLDLLNKSCASAWALTAKVSIDEALVAFQGRLAFKHYMPDKPEKRGIKVWKICDSRGFMYQFDVYTGKSEDKEEDESTVESVVKLLTRDIQGEQPYHLFADNFYSSIPLALKLLEKKIYYTGTLRENRKFIPKALKDYPLARKGDCVSLQRERTYFAQALGQQGRLLHLYSSSQLLTWYSTTDRRAWQQGTPCASPDNRRLQFEHGLRGPAQPVHFLLQLRQEMLKVVAVALL